MTTADVFTRKYTSEEARALKEVGYGLHSTTPETAKKYLNAGGYPVEPQQQHVLLRA